MFQLGLNQMPDASSQNIMSYIAWYCITLFFGFWMSNVVCEVLTHCTDSILTMQIAGLLPVLCMCVVQSLQVETFLFSINQLIFPYLMMIFSTKHGNEMKCCLAEEVRHPRVKGNVLDTHSLG